MAGTSCRARGRPIPSGLIGLIVLVGAIEAGLGDHTGLTTDMAEHWRGKWRAASVEATSSDVLCFGDSLVELAVLPKVVEERSRRPAYNLALPAGTPAASYFLLKKALDSGARPRGIVVDFLPLGLVRQDYFENTRKRLWPELAGIFEVLHFAWARRDPEFAASMILARALKSFRSRDEIRAAVVARLNGTETGTHDDAVFLTWRNLRSNRGSLVQPRGSRVADTSVAILDVKVSRFDPVFVDYADRFLRLAASRAIPVYCLLAPISPEYQAAYDAAGTAAEHSAFLRAKQAEFPNLIVVDGRHSGYEPSHFVDNVHMNRRGATALSIDLADLIDRGPGPDRWSDLPRFREPAKSDAVEDTDQSRIAIATRGLLR